MTSDPDEGSVCIAKEPCPQCGSRDNLARYSDGHAYCFSPGCGHRERADGSPERHPQQQRSRMELLQGGVIEAIPNRGLTKETCARYGYRVGEYRGGKCHIAPYYDDAGTLVAQKVRFKENGEKAFVFPGDPRAAGLFGQRLARDAGKMVVITEGELDALSVSQALGNNWPALSLPKGAGNAAKDIARHVSWLSRFDKVVLCFDMDDPGRKAVEQCVPLFPPGKVHVATLPDGFKDANEMIVANRSKELADAVFGARVYRPDGVRTVSQLKAGAMKTPGWGLPWPWRSFTEANYGIRRRELYGWGAGVGSGKTTTMKQLMLTAMRPELLEPHDGLVDWRGNAIPIPEPRKIGTILFEENPEKTLRTLAGMAIGKRVLKPDVPYDEAELEAAMDSFDDLLFAFDTFGAKDWTTIKSYILHLVLSEGVKDVFLDPVTALVAMADDERRELDLVMAELSGLVETHDFTLHYVSHLTTPDGKPHEEGGRVMEKHFTGSRALARWTHNMIGLERDKQNRDAPTVLRGLKDREHGEAVGPLLGLTFDRETGRMVECPLPSEGGKPFKDETQHGDI